jgi:hypothetical protein
MPTFFIRSGSVSEDFVPPQRDAQIQRLVGEFAQNVEIGRDEGRVEITFVMDAEDIETATAIAERALTEFAGDGSPWPGGTVVTRRP